MNHATVLREKFREHREAMEDHEIASLAGFRIPTGATVGKYIDMTLDELIDIGIPPHDALTIASIKELAQRYLGERMEKRDVLSAPARVVDFLKLKIGGLPHEAFCAIFLTTQNEVITHEIVNEGTIDQVAVYPRRIIEMALKHHAAALIIAHNHPSGFTDPSEEDKNLTRTLRSACTVMDIRLLDHMIVGKSGYFSFLERGLL